MVVAVGRVTAAAILLCCEPYSATRAEWRPAGVRQSCSLTAPVVMRSINRQSVAFCWASPAAVNGALSWARQTRFCPDCASDAHCTAGALAAAEPALAPAQMSTSIATVTAEIDRTQ